MTEKSNIQEAVSQEFRIDLRNKCQDLYNTLSRIVYPRQDDNERSLSTDMHVAYEQVKALHALIDNGFFSSEGR